MDELPQADRRQDDMRHVAGLCTRSRIAGGIGVAGRCRAAMLTAVCGTLGWEYGALWEVERAGRSCAGAARGTPGRCSSPNSWRAAGRLCSDAASAARPGVGVGAAGVDSRRRPRRQFSACRGGGTRRAARRVGLPILRGADVLGVMEFFSRDMRQPDAALLEMLTTVGSQIGLYVERKWAADELERSSLSRSTCSASRASTAISSGSIPRGRTSRLRRGRAVRRAVHRFRASRRSRRDDRRGVGAHHGRPR